MRYQFDCAEHPEYGSLGWRLTNMPAFDPLPGMAVAHDILEHRRNDDSTTGELMALGAMLYVRGEDYFHSKGSHYTRPSYHFNGELGDLLLKISYGEWVPLRTYPKAFSTCHDATAREEISEGIKLCKKYLRVDRELLPEQIQAIDWANIANWMKHGFNMAQKRYRNVDRHDLTELFTEIERQADGCLKNAEEGITRLIVDLTWTQGHLADRRIPQYKIYIKESYV